VGPKEEADAGRRLAARVDHQGPAAEHHPAQPSQQSIRKKEQQLLQFDQQWIQGSSNATQYSIEEQPANSSKKAAVCESASQKGRNWLSKCK
jgi:hypothetical protein